MNLHQHISNLKKLALIFFLLNLFFIPNLKSQTYFTSIDTLVSPYLFNQSIIQWIDYDNDNDLDLFIIIGQALQIYENLGNNIFQYNNNNSLYYHTLNIGFTYKDIGDINNDGNMDILARGGGTNNYILKNTLPDSIGFDTASFAGHMLISGFDNIFNYKGNDLVFRSYANYVQVLARLNDSLTLSDIDSFPLNVQFPSLKENLDLNSSKPNNMNYLFYFHLLQSDNYDRYRTHNYDFNKDGYFDYINFGGIALNNGLDSSNRFTLALRPRPQLYTNYIYGGLRGDMHFYDLDNDGYLDVCENHFGDTRFNPYSNKIYRNNHNNQLIEQTNTGLDTLWHNEQCLFDYDNDGRIDVMLSKSNDSTFIFKNNGNFNFTQDSAILNLPYKFNDAATADYDNDGDIDLAVLYNDTVSNQYKVIIFRNDSTTPNNPPTKPEVLWTTMDSTKIIFHWKQATDVETPQAALGYNVMVGTSPNGIDIVSPLADTATGFRKVVRLGNAQLNDFFILDKSKFNIGDTLYWRVQTLDNSHGYSPFSQSQMTVVCNRIEAPVFDTICSNDSLLWHGDYYSQTGRFKKTYGASQCDSTFFLDLSLNPAYLNQQTVDICAGNTYSWYGNNYYVSGTYTQNHTTTKGCDSIEKLVLNVRQTYTNILSDSICIGDSIQIGPKWITDEGYYIDTLNSIHSCDSIIWLDLKTNPNDTNIIVQGTKLIGQDFSASYRWLDCDAQLFIPGANKRVFSPYLDGNYAAEISLNGCSYLTKCYSITGTGIGNLESSDIKIFPNPTESFVIIESQNQQISKIVLKSIDGKVLKIIEDINSTNQKIDLNSFEKGIYIFQIWVEGEVFYYKVLRQ